MSRVTRAWGLLLALSALSTFLAAAGLSGAPFVIGVLALAGFKARVILGDYLGLVHAPDWLRGFDLGLGALLLAFAVLALAG